MLSSMDTTTETTDHESYEVVLDAPELTYTYLGRDAEGYYHHYDGDRETVYVTENDAEIDTSGVHRRFRVHGAVDHVEEGVSGRDLEPWTAFVAGRRGWDDLALVVIPLPSIDACVGTHEEVI